LLSRRRRRGVRRAGSSAKASRLLRAALLASALALASGAAAGGSVNSGAVAAPELTADSACGEIRAALNDLAKAERAQALALDLVSAEGAGVIVETRLSELLQRSNDLRVTLRRVRQSPVGGDQYVSQCITIGFRALVEAEKLSTDVEEVMYGASSAPPAAASALKPAAAPPLKWDASPAPAAPTATP